MGAPRDLLDEADRLTRLSERAAEIAAGLDVKHNRALDIGGVTLYQHNGYPDDLLLIDRLRSTMEQAAADYAAQAAAVEARVTTVTS